MSPGNSGWNSFQYVSHGRLDLFLHRMETNRYHTGTVRFVPEWFPGAGFKKLARELGKTSSRVESIPFEWTLANMVGFKLSYSFRTST